MRNFLKFACFNDGGDGWGEDPDGGGYDDHDVEVPDTESGQGVKD